MEVMEDSVWDILGQVFWRPFSSWHSLASPHRQLFREQDAMQRSYFTLTHALTKSQLVKNGVALIKMGLQDCQGRAQARCGKMKSEKLATAAARAHGENMKLG